MNRIKGVRATGRYLALAGLTATVLLVSGCATMSAEECMVADWYGLGQSDARAGRTSSYLANRAGDCAEAGYPADTEAWHQGFADGLGWFCTIDNGFRFGLEGQRYQQSCPPELEGDFSDGYELGLAIHSARGRVSELQRQYDAATRELRKLERADRPDRELIADQRDERDRLHDRLRAEELELATLLGVAQGRGFRVPR
jgi:hypothetical protein